MSIKSMDDLPNIPEENRFAFSADLAENLVPEVPDGYWRIRPEYVDSTSFDDTIRFARQYEPSSDILPVHPDIVDAIAAVLAKDTDRWRCGLLLRAGSFWVGAHWSRENKRLCVNVVPFVTLWVTAPGGSVP